MNLHAARYRPFVRWWWFGGALEREEIAFQLEEMKNSGIGGIEIQPVYPLGAGQGDEPRNLEWLSDEFLEMLRYAAEKASSLGMTTDMTLGSGWPFGGPHIPKRLAARKLRYEYWDLGGNQTWSSDDNPLGDDEEPVVVLAAPVENGLIDYHGLVSIDGDRWVIPRGTWRVMRYASSYTRMMVKRATVGSEGWVANHFSREAMELHFREVGDRLVEATGGKVGCYFSDSWEVFGSNWTENFIEEFKRRRGYSILRYLPALDNYVKDISPRIRYDYHRTLSDLVLEAYIIPMREWCHRHNCHSRVQAHGTTPADILRCYGESDIPECETGGWADGSGIGRTPKFASSAAHLYGRDVVSCETFTHLRRPRFQVSPRMLKVAADRIHCHGVNHLVYHGYSYSPRILGSPGWVFYASTMFNHNNTWWPYAKHLNLRNQTLSRELQKGKSTADILVYSSLADVWCKKTSQTRPSTLSLLSSQLGRLPEIIWSSGYDFDIVNDEILGRVQVEEGHLRVSDLSYSVLLIPEIDYVPLETARKLHEIVMAGGRIILVDGKTPRPTTCDSGERGRIEEYFSEMKEQLKENHGYQLEQPGVDIQNLLRAFIQPDLQMPHPDPEIVFIHRRLGDGEIYFLSNSGSSPKITEIAFRVRGLVPYEIEPESGKQSEICVYRSEPDRTVLSLNIDPYGSKLLLFSKKEGGKHLLKSEFTTHHRIGEDIYGEASSPGEYQVLDRAGHKGHVYAGEIPRKIPLVDWAISNDGNGPDRRLDRLKSWTEIDGLQKYSGRLTYKSTFRLEKEHLDQGMGLKLGLGDIREVATVYINGKKSGELWTPPYVLDIQEFVKLGVNSIEVEVTNLIINRILGLPEPDFGKVNDKYGRRFPDPRERRECHPQQSGMLGPVEIKAYRLVLLDI